MQSELRSYLSEAADPDVQHLATRCRPWSVRDLTAHLAATFSRFNALLARGRAGDLSPPFARDELSRENLRAVGTFSGDPVTALETEVAAFTSAADDLDEVMPHQFGPIPVGLQLGFGLNELALHHDDVAEALGRSYRPDDDVVAALTIVWERVLAGLSAGDEAWERIRRASGRGIG